MNEYVVFWERDKDDQWSVTDVPVEAFKREDGVVTIYGPKSAHDNFIFFSKTNSWKEFVKLGEPLSAWLGGNPYNTAEVLEGENAVERFNKIVAKLDFKPVSFGKKMKFSDMKVVVDET